MLDVNHKSVPTHYEVLSEKGFAFNHELTYLNEVAYDVNHGSPDVDVCPLLPPVRVAVASAATVAVAVTTMKRKAHSGNKKILINYLLLTKVLYRTCKTLISHIMFTTTPMLLVTSMIFASMSFQSRLTSLMTAMASRLPVSTQMMSTEMTAPTTSMRCHP